MKYLKWYLKKKLRLSVSELALLLQSKFMFIREQNRQTVNQRCLQVVKCLVSL